jgi:hypothetical protein
VESKAESDYKEHRIQSEQSERALGAWCLSRPSTGRAPPRPSGAAPARLATWPAERVATCSGNPARSPASPPRRLTSHLTALVRQATARVSSKSDRQGQFENRPPGASGAQLSADGTSQLSADGT